MLNEKENKKYQIIEKLVTGEITRKDASEELNLSLKQISRLKKFFIEGDKTNFIHKNRGKKSKKKIDTKIIEELEDLYLKEYYDYNFEAFYEEITEKYNYKVSYQFILKQFTNDDIISPLAHKKTVKKYQEKLSNMLNNNSEIISDDKVELYKSRIVATEKAHTRRSNNSFVFGQEIQMDACEAEWFGGIVTYLHLAVDKATKKILFGWFEYEEITRGYYVLLFNIIINYGIPTKIKTDNRSTFSANKGKNKGQNVFLTQFEKVCEELEIKLETTSVPTAKPNVERENKTFKGRLIAELRHEGITEIEDANYYVNNNFIPKMNDKFSYSIDEETSMMKQNQYTTEELKLIISEKKNRIIDNASAISYQKKYYIPIDIQTGEIVCYMKGTECTFIINYDGEYYSKIEEHYYKMIELENRDSIMTKESEIPKKEKKHQYIPPANHPWRKNMMLK